MRIEVVRTGGFAGIQRRAAVETAGHPDAPRLESLADRAVSAPPPPPGRPPTPDGFTYTITAGPRSARCADPHLTPAQRELITALLREGA